MTTATLAPCEHDRGTADLSRAWGLSHDRLSREMAIREAAGLDAYRRIGRSRVVSPAQVEPLKEWLRRRGLLPGEPGDDDVRMSGQDRPVSTISRGPDRG